MKGLEMVRINSLNWPCTKLNNFYHCTVHSDIHTVHSPTDAHLLELWLQFTLKSDGSYMFRSTTIIRELAIEPGLSYIGIQTFSKVKSQFHECFNVNITLARFKCKAPWWWS